MYTDKGHFKQCCTIMRRLYSFCELVKYVNDIWYSKCCWSCTIIVVVGVVKKVWKG
jgi:hypothetical protein